MKAHGLAVLVCTLSLFGTTEASAASKPEETNPPAFRSANPESLAAAKQYLSDLDQAMLDSIAVLKKGQLQGLHAQSKYFNYQVEKGRSLFGSTIFEPLGRCFAAGNYSRAWWQEQLSAAQRGGTESVSGSIKETLEEYQLNRDECLKDADPVASGKAEAELDEELKKKFGGGRECLAVITVDPETKEVVTGPKPAHCKN
ncbi:hypothetical protein [Pseudomonas aeruginosa]